MPIYTDLSTQYTGGEGNIGSLNIWKSGVPFIIDQDTFVKSPDCIQKIIEAIDNFNKRIYVVKWNEKQDSDTDYVKFTYDPEHCSSYVGKIGGQQEIYISHWAKVGNILHEMGHVIGLHHEHQRFDREVYGIKISRSLLSNINYKKEGIVYGGYDYSSIMHYPKSSYLKHINTFDEKESKEIGQRNSFSDSDIDTIQALYKGYYNKCINNIKIAQDNRKKYDDIVFDTKNIRLWHCKTCWGNPPSLHIQTKTIKSLCGYCAVEGNHRGHHLEPLKIPSTVFSCDSNNSEYATQTQKNYSYPPLIIVILSGIGIVSLIYMRSKNHKK